MLKLCPLVRAESRNANYLRLLETLTLQKGVLALSLMIIFPCIMWMVCIIPRTWARVTQADHFLPANNDVETTASPFTASVSFKSKLPSLLLEDIEHLVDRIQCKPESIELTFTSKEHMETARDAFASHPNLVIVTSHFGCNNDESRIPWV